MHEVFLENNSAWKQDVIDACVLKHEEEERGGGELSQMLFSTLNPACCNSDFCDPSSSVDSGADMRAFRKMVKL